MDRNGLPVTELPRIPSVISVFSVVKGVCIVGCDSMPHTTLSSGFLALCRLIVRHRLVVRG